MSILKKVVSLFILTFIVLVTVHSALSLGQTTYIINPYTSRQDAIRTYNSSDFALSNASVDLNDTFESVTARGSSTTSTISIIPSACIDYLFQVNNTLGERVLTIDCAGNIQHWQPVAGPVSWIEDAPADLVPSDSNPRWFTSNLTKASNPWNYTSTLTKPSNFVKFRTEIDVGSCSPTAVCNANCRVQTCGKGCFASNCGGGKTRCTNAYTCTYNTQVTCEAAAGCTWSPQVGSGEVSIYTDDGTDASCFSDDGTDTQELLGSDGSYHINNYQNGVLQGGATLTDVGQWSTDAGYTTTAAGFLASDTVVQGAAATMNSYSTVGAVFSTDDTYLMWDDNIAGFYVDSTGVWADAIQPYGYDTKVTVSSDLVSTGTIYTNTVEAVCTATNGLCSEINSAGGWTNNTQNTTTMLNVGIGTTTPGAQLHVSSPSGTIPVIANAATGHTGDLMEWKLNNAIKGWVDYRGYIYGGGYWGTVGGGATTFANSGYLTTPNLNNFAFTANQHREASGTTNHLYIAPTYNQLLMSNGSSQVSTAGGTDLKINRAETSLGNGTHLLADFQVDSVSRFKMTNAGATSFTPANSTGLTDVLVNPTAKTTGNLLDLQVTSSSKFYVDYLGRVSARSYEATTGAFGAPSGAGMILNAGQTFTGVNQKISVDFSTPTFTNTYAGQNYGLRYMPTYNTAGTGVGYTDFLINRTETNLGTTPLTNYLIDAQVNGVTKFSVTNGGILNAAQISSNGYVNSGSGLFAHQNLNTIQLNYGPTSTFTTADKFNANVGSKHGQTSGLNGALSIKPTYNQTSGTAANTDLFINRTETAVGSGAQNLIDAQVDGTSKFSVTNTGAVSAVSYAINGSAGATGSFTTTDGKTVTVTNGLITAIV